VFLRLTPKLVLWPTCLHTDTQTHTHTDTHTCAHMIYMHTHTDTHTCMCTHGPHAYTQTHRHTHTHTCMCTHCIFLHLFIYSLIYCVCVCVCVHAHVCVHHDNIDVAAGGQLAGINSPLLPCGFWGLNSACQTWQQAPLPRDPSCQPRHTYTLRSLMSFCKCSTPNLGG